MEKLTFEKLPELMGQVLEKLQTLENILNEKHLVKNTEELLSIQEASAFLNLSVPTLYSKVSKREIPVSKPGNRLYFNKSELTDWIKSGRKKTLSEVQEDASFLIKNNRLAKRTGMRYR
jgi:excisionase family DNA binding protein